MGKEFLRGMHRLGRSHREDSPDLIGFGERGTPQADSL